MARSTAVPSVLLAVAIEKSWTVKMLIGRIARQNLSAPVLHLLTLISKTTGKKINSKFLEFAVLP
jgi:hypothetical protein